MTASNASTLLRPVGARRTNAARSLPDATRPARPADAVHAVTILQEFGTRLGATFGERESAAMTVLYREHAATLLQIARRLTRNADDAQDVVQQVFVDLPKALQQYRHGNFTGWLRCVTARAALMCVRRQSRRREDSDATVPQTALAVSEPEDFDALADVAALRQAIGALREPYREIIALRVYADLSHQEISSLLGISPNASEVRLCRAIKQLRHLLPQMSSGSCFAGAGS